MLAITTISHVHSKLVLEASLEGLSYYRKFLSIASGFVTCFNLSDLREVCEHVDTLSPGNFAW